MSNQEILEKAIKKAIDGGWSPIEPRFDKRVKHRVNYFFNYWEWLDDCSYYGHWYDYEDVGVLKPCEIIFNHNFAKALWGEDLIHGFMNNSLGINETVQFHEPSWQYHLQQMVIAEDPIRRLSPHNKDGGRC